MRGRDEAVSAGIVEGDGVEIDLFVVDALHLSDGMGEGGLHTDTEDVEFEQAEGLHVVLVELTHRIALAARFDRGAIEQAGVGEQDTAWMHGDVTGQTIEAFDELPEMVELTALGHATEAGGVEFRQVTQGVAGITRADMREGLGEGVDLTGRQGKGRSDIANGVAHAIGLHH